MEVAPLFWETMSGIWQRQKRKSKKPSAPERRGKLHPATPAPRRKAFKSAIALFLTFTAGYVDVVGLLTVYRMFTAHMTGTTVHLGEQIIQRNWKAAMIAGDDCRSLFSGLGRRANAD